MRSGRKVRVWKQGRVWRAALYNRHGVKLNSTMTVTHQSALEWAFKKVGLDGLK